MLWHLNNAQQSRKFFEAFYISMPEMKCSFKTSSNTLMNNIKRARVQGSSGGLMYLCQIHFSWSLLFQFKSIRRGGTAVPQYCTDTLLGEHMETTTAAYCKELLGIAIEFHNWECKIWENQILLNYPRNSLRNKKGLDNLNLIIYVEWPFAGHIFWFQDPTIGHARMY